MPRFSDDDVVDFMVREAVILNGFQARKQAEKAQEREEWKKRPVGSGNPGT